MDFSAILAHPFLLLAAAVFCIFVLRHMAHKSSSPNRKKRFRLAGAFIGNALLPLHAIIHPHTKHIIAEQMQDREDDPGADPDDPTQHFEKQLKRIRSGERLDHLTTRTQQHRGRDLPGNSE